MREFVEETPNDKPEQNVRMNFLPFFGLFVSLGIAAITFVWIMIAPSFSDPMAPLTSAIMSVFLNGVAFLIWIASVLGESAKKKENRTIFGNTVFIVLSLFLYIYWVCLLTGMNGFRYGFNGFH